MLEWFSAELIVIFHSEHWGISPTFAFDLHFLPFNLLSLSLFHRFFTKENRPKELCCVSRCQQTEIFIVPFP